MTKKQARARDRIELAGRRKRRKRERFAYKLAARKTGQAPQLSFCCLPERLDMSIDAFLGHGQVLAGGEYHLFPSGKLDEIMPAAWTCSARTHPHLLTREYIEGRFEQDGRQIGSTYTDSNW